MGKIVDFYFGFFGVPVGVTVGCGAGVGVVVV
jgi:hypothetical protein